MQSFLGGKAGWWDMYLGKCWKVSKWSLAEKKRPLSLALGCSLQSAQEKTISPTLQANHYSVRKRFDVENNSCYNYN